MGAGRSERQIRSVTLLCTFCAYSAEGYRNGRSLLRIMGIVSGRPIDVDVKTFCSFSAAGWPRPQLLHGTSAVRRGIESGPVCL